MANLVMNQNNPLKPMIRVSSAHVVSPSLQCLARAICHHCPVRFVVVASSTCHCACRRRHAVPVPPLVMHNMCERVRDGEETDGMVEVGMTPLLSASPGFFPLRDKYHVEPPVSGGNILILEK